MADLGEHRLKDLAEPVWLYQLGDGSFPPIRSLSNTNLPVPASSFLGREADLEAAAELLAGARLLTIAGPGGAGKTRFAIELASLQLERFPNGVFWVPLAPLRDPARCRRRGRLARQSRLCLTAPGSSRRRKAVL